MALTTSFRRSKKNIDNKRLHEGDSLPRSILTKKECVRDSTVLPRKYLVERIICSKSTHEGQYFLIKWDGFHSQESTWEPSNHIPKELIDSYLCPPVSTERLNIAKEAFEHIVQERLSTKNSALTTDFPLDIYRFAFGTDKEVLITSDRELARLTLCKNWNYKINKYGEGVRLSLPMRIKPRCFLRPIYVRAKDGHFIKMLLPVERITLIGVIEPVNW